MHRSHTLFRVDADAHVGLGHLSRCLALASALQDVGIDCPFVSRDNPATRKALEVSGFRLVSLNGAAPWTSQEAERIARQAQLAACGTVVVDSYNARGAYLRLLRATGLSVVVIDDLARQPFDCHIVVNANAGAEQLPYRSTSGRTQFLLGPSYALLRREFRNLPKRTIRSAAQRILLTVGGTDPQHLTARWLPMLDGLPGRLAISVIHGPFFPGRPALAVAAKRSRHTVRVLRAPDSLHELMMEADLAISAGGHTLYELAASGTPTIAIPMAENQQRNVRALATIGIVQTAELPRENAAMMRVRRVVQRVLASRDLRAQMSAAGRRLVDGRGAERVAQVVLELCESRV